VIEEEDNDDQIVREIEEAKAVENEEAEEDEVNFELENFDEIGDEV
jgi:hypothetical protein